MVEVRFGRGLEGIRTTAVYFLDTPWQGRLYEVRKLSWGKPVEYRARRAGFQGWLRRAFVQEMPLVEGVVPFDEVGVRRLRFPQFALGPFPEELGSSTRAVIEDLGPSLNFLLRFATPRFLAERGLTVMDIRTLTESQLLRQLAEDEISRLPLPAEELLPRPDEEVQPFVDVRIRRVPGAPPTHPVDLVLAEKKSEVMDELFDLVTRAQFVEMFRTLKVDKIDVVLMDYPLPEFLAERADAQFRGLMEAHRYVFQSIRMGVEGWGTVRVRKHRWAGLKTYLEVLQEQARISGAPDTLVRDIAFGDFLELAVRTEVFDRTDAGEEFLARVGMSREEVVRRFLEEEETARLLGVLPFRTDLSPSEIRALKHLLRMSVRVTLRRLRTGELRPTTP